MSKLLQMLKVMIFEIAGITVTTEALKITRVKSNPNKAEVNGFEINREIKIFNDVAADKKRKRGLAIKKKTQKIKNERVQAIECPRGMYQSPGDSKYGGGRLFVYTTKTLSLRSPRTQAFTLRWAAHKINSYTRWAPFTKELERLKPYGSSAVLVESDPKNEKHESSPYQARVACKGTNTLEIKRRQDLHQSDTVTYSAKLIQNPNF